MTRGELLQIAKPILFNTDMVRAILDGRKTVTRRCVKPKYKDGECGFQVITKKNGEFVRVEKTDENGLGIFADGTERIVSQPYYIGDILYVRETWHKYTKRVGKGEECHLQEFYGYKVSIANYEDAKEKWRPSLHMPKEAARIFLKVKDVRVERLQDITMEQILAEGIKISQFDLPNTSVDAQFKQLWNSTIKKADRVKYGWDVNPWVWVIEFERIEVSE